MPLQTPHPRLTRRVIPWNQGKLIGQKPPLKLKEIWAIRIRLQLDHRARELALFNLTFHPLDDTAVKLVKSVSGRRRT